MEFWGAWTGGFLMGISVGGLVVNYFTKREAAMWRTRAEANEHELFLFRVQGLKK